MNPRAKRVLAVVLLFALILPTLLACGSPSPKPAGQPAGSEATVAQPEEPTAAPAEPPSSGSGDPTKRAADAFGLLMGTSGDASALPSCHIDLTSAWPAWNRDAKAVSDYSLSMQADVQGKNVRFTYTQSEAAGGETSETEKGEGIVVGDENKEYEIVDGQANESIGVGLVWVSWPLQPVIVLSLASLGATPAGTEGIDGRTAEVYAVDMAKADPAVLEGVQAFIAKGMTKAAGKMWVDQETGALLKASVDYEEDLYEMGTDDVVGHGAGHFEILVTQVGKVTVEVPSGD